VPENEQNPPSARPPILATGEAARRAALLSDLSSALEAQGVSTVLARTRRLVLGTKPHKRPEPSGPTDPQLHVFTPDGTAIITTDGTSYLSRDGSAYLADDSAQAARQIRSRSAHEHPVLTVGTARQSARQGQR
jgi:hypothetical protein